MTYRARRNRYAAAAIAGLSVAALTSVALAVEQAGLDSTLYPRIVNGVLTHDYPAVGAVLRGDFPDWAQHVPITADNATSFCSGTLIGCRTFLTAGHCTTTAFSPGTLDADEAWVYLPHAGIFAVTSIARHPDYTLASLGVPINDVAVLNLGAPVTGIAPMPVNRSDPNRFIPAAGTIVGFGRTSGVGVVDKPSARSRPAPAIAPRTAASPSIA
jgi:secreted trypsin-like serine protease